MPDRPSGDKRVQAAYNLDRLRLDLLNKESNETLFLDPAVMIGKYPDLSGPVYMRRSHRQVELPQTFSSLHPSVFTDDDNPPYSGFVDGVEVTRYVNFGGLDTPGSFSFLTQSDQPAKLAPVDHLGFTFDEDEELDEIIRQEREADTRRLKLVKAQEDNHSVETDGVDEPNEVEETEPYKFDEADKVNETNKVDKAADEPEPEVIPEPDPKCYWVQASKRAEKAGVVVANTATTIPEAQYLMWANESPGQELVDICGLRDSDDIGPLSTSKAISADVGQGITEVDITRRCAILIRASGHIQEAYQKVGRLDEVTFPLGREGRPVTGYKMPFISSEVAHGLKSGASFRLSYPKCAKGWAKDK